MSNVWFAEKLAKAIADSIEIDQGAQYRQISQRVLPHIGDAYRGKDSPFRSHLGASVIGRVCGRDIWYGWRWAVVPHFTAKTLRLFNRGHLEEGRVIAALLCAGVQVFQQDENGKQFRISEFGGHFGGSGDGIVLGIPDLPEGTMALLECKTHNDKSFALLKKEGVRSAKFEHFVQMMKYATHMGAPYSLYVAVNKNTDELWLELVETVPAVSSEFSVRARSIIFAKQPPEKINKSPGWYECQYCSHRTVCHLGGVPAVNCRTCKFSEPTDDGKWQCMNDRTWLELDLPRELPKEAQEVACPLYERLI